MRVQVAFGVGFMGGQVFGDYLGSGWAFCVIWVRLPMSVFWLVLIQIFRILS
jgi:hypothetical protein